MNTETQTAMVVKPNAQSALTTLATRLGAEPQKLLETLKQTVFKGATNEELLALTVVANQYGLNPLTKELYAFPAKGGGIVPVVSVDGWCRILNDHPAMDGIEFEWEHSPSGEPISCTAVIYRKDRNRPVKVTEYFSECKRNTEPWKMAHRMLRHKALIQGARVAFGFGGIYDDDEAREIAARVEMVASQPARPVFSLPSPEKEAEPERKTRKKKEVETFSGEADEIPGLAAPKEEEAPLEIPEPPDTPQRRFATELAKREITEKKAIEFLQKEYGIKAQLVSELTDEQAVEALKDISLIW